MTCRDVADFLADYLSGALPVSRARTFEAHLAECPDCVAYMESYRATLVLGRRAYTDAASDPDVPAELIDAILAALRPPDGGPPPAR